MEGREDDELVIMFGSLKGVDVNLRRIRNGRKAGRNPQKKGLNLSPRLHLVFPSWNRPSPDLAARRDARRASLFEERKATDDGMLSSKSSKRVIPNLSIFWSERTYLEINFHPELALS
jgi:hypothetical protein